MEIKIEEQEDGGRAVYIQELDGRTRVRILKENGRKWVLLSQEWRRNAWHPQCRISEQPSLAQALVRAGAWLQEGHGYDMGTPAPSEGRTYGGRQVG